MTRNTRNTTTRTTRVTKFTKSTIRKSISRAAVIASLVAAAIAPTTAFADVDTITANVDLNQYQTYSWNLDSADELSVAELAIRDAVDREMANQGYTKLDDANGQADLQASLSASSRTEVRIDSRPAMTMSPRFDRWAWSRGVEVAQVREIEQGRFDVRLSDAENSELVWHGTAEGMPRSKMEKNVEEINEAVEEMFEDFGESND